MELCTRHFDNYKPVLKKWDYSGFAMSFRDSVIPWLSFLDSVTAKFKCILLNNFNVCGPNSMKLIVHLVPKVSKVVAE